MDLTLNLLATLRQEIIELLDEDIQLFVIGAFASQLWLHEHESDTYRATRDIDFVVGVPDYISYTRLRDRLADLWPRVSSIRNGHTLILDDGVIIDLLPFEDYVLKHNSGNYDVDEIWQGPEELVGFSEVAKRGTKKYSIDGKAVESATVPAIIGLKLFALDDRPDKRLKDAQDIGNLLKHYPAFEDESVWDNHFDLFSEDMLWPGAGYIALGREVRKVFTDNTVLCTRLVDIITRIISGELKGLKWLSDGLELELEEALPVIQQFKRGLSEQLT